jgi:hypothetical protein
MILLLILTTTIITVVIITIITIIVIITLMESSTMLPVTGTHDIIYFFHPGSEIGMGGSNLNPPSLGFDLHNDTMIEYIFEQLGTNNDGFPESIWAAGHNDGINDCYRLDTNQDGFVGKTGADFETMMP